MKEAFDQVQKVEDLFKELDQNKFTHVVTLLGALRKELMQEGFTRREAMRLVEAYAKFVYDYAMEDFVSGNRREELDIMDEMDNDLPEDDD